jgi:hypothetical protein
MVKTTMKEKPTPNQVLQEIMADDEFREDHEKEELVKKKKKENEKKDDDKKSVAFKATSSKSKGKKKKEESSSEDEPCSSSSGQEEEVSEQMALLVKRMGKLMKKGYRSKGKRSSSKSSDRPMKCFRCNSKDHLIAKCPYASDDEDAMRKERKKQEKKKEEKDSSHHKKKGESHVATWESDSSSSSDDDDDDSKKKKKKGHASIAIQEKLSLFGAPSSCFMAKATKVQPTPDSDDESDDDDDTTKEELWVMLEDCKGAFNDSRKECRGLRKDKQNLEQELMELRASYESLKVDHKKLEIAHSKLEKAHSSLVEKQEKVQSQVMIIEKKDVSTSCDSLDDSIVVASLGPSCSYASTSSSSVGHACDSTLVVENESLKKEVKELNHTLAKAYGGEDRLLMCLGSQRASLYKEGLGYTPKKGKAAFAPHKTSFVKNNGSYCKSCKQVGHLEHACKNKNTSASSYKLNASYMLVKSECGVSARFIGTPWKSSKEKAIWVPKLFGCQSL